VARLLLFASAREAAGRSRDTIDGATVADVLAAATQQFGPRFETVLASCTVWLNGEECEPDAPVVDSDEVAVLPPVSGGSGDLAAMSLADVRARRTELQKEEDAVSFVRRVAQGRLDMARDEERRRTTGAAHDRDVTDGITRVFAAERGGGSNRPPRDTEPEITHPLFVELESLCESVGFGGLRELDLGELATCCARLADFESRASARRKDLFAEIDALSGELVRRYRESSANVDVLLDENR
jgi:molybdopterin synthase sulfur carrier subunit